MLSFSGSLKVYVALEHCDMRNRDDLRALLPAAWAQSQRNGKRDLSQSAAA